MDNKDIRIIKKIIEHLKSILEVTRDINDAEAFKNTNDKSKAAMFDLLQIGELAQNGLSKNLLDEMNNIPWKEIYALRNRIVHGYSSVDYLIIWETIQNDIPELYEDLSDIVAANEAIEEYYASGCKSIPFEEVEKEINML